MQEIQLYKPMIAVILFDGREYYIPADAEKDFERTILEQKFVRIEGKIINTSAIKETEHVKKLSSLLSLSFEDRKTIDLKTKNYCENMGKHPSLGTIDNWIKSLTA